MKKKSGGGEAGIACREKQAAVSVSTESNQEAREEGGFCHRRRKWTRVLFKKWSR